MFRSVAIPPAWRAVEDSLLVRRFVPDTSSSSASPPPALVKIAAFDFDDTLVKKHNHDLAFPSVLDKLKALHEEGFMLAMFSNEALDHLKKTESLGRALNKKLDRLQAFMERAQLPFRIYLATRKDKFRKPSMKDVKAGGDAMWTMLVEDLTREAASGMKVDMEASFFCGDAAGRRGEFSDADLGFANAVGLRFEHAKDYFLCARTAEDAGDGGARNKRARVETDVKI